MTKAGDAQVDAMTPGEALLRKLESIYGAYMILEEGLPLVLSLWNLHTHMYQDFCITPYFWIHSPVRACGKTTLCRLLHVLSANAQYTVGISKAALYRIIEAREPTLIMDEAEGLMNDREMLALINAGYSRSTGPSSVLTGMGCVATRFTARRPLPRSSRSRTR